MRRIALLGAALLAVGVIVLFVLPFDAIDSCLDHGGRWDYKGDKCECTPEELADPRVTKELATRCDTPAPAPQPG